MGVHLWGTFAKQLAPRSPSGIMWAVNQNKWRHLIGRRYRPTLAMRCTLNGNTVLGNNFTFKKRNRNIDVQSQSSLVHKYLFYTCPDFGWLIRVNAEAMLLWSQKTCKQTKIVKFSHFIFDHKGQLWQDSIQRLLHISTKFFFVIKIHIVLFKTVPGLVDTPLR